MINFVKFKRIFFFALLHLHGMNKKFVVINSLLAMVVLFSILFQSVHSYEHLAKQISQKHCHHKPTSGSQITHQHHNFDHCFICNFTLGGFVCSGVSCFQFIKKIIFTRYSFLYSREITNFFKGSLFALRAPPSFMF
ncbi:hypothetical protein SAMN02745938_11147 [Flavobacterium psychrophilum DSM 3660]|uniref:hypothetical protein n=1 Tax=Flavobacterium psychrophilum TaxID=96345 RepID=UPI00068D1DAD|nr:hypothetical protein [Flavobacterium psychrophilum]EKT3966138.1 hypothetical protein [Flavobacterium psychrophilum]OXB14988.1 hypothetical protein B0A57_00985 [Flavobacterium psychrophilum DSM 3660 = ATCC 49418]SCY22471.1 hypothetical protein SAMN02745938_11147 [Flavobacterium psychrophilum DSM 3660] [Flavobacterium psychrophilum DSM 3660 = ATCC 49418]SHI01645.1 Hypothetical protein THC0290_1678 [Flavobacterium psychrophilum]SNA77697.1 conserved hypothetical protein [Flavobacterium psychrop